jgi:hypothetical protein
MTPLEIFALITSVSSIIAWYLNFTLWRTNRQIIKAGKEYAHKVQYFINHEARPRDLRYFSQWLDLKGWVQVGEFWTNRKDLGKEKISTDELIRLYILAVGNIKFT